jgi:iron complex transport system ATP-binding protein
VVSGAALQLRGVGFAYGAAPVLRDLSFEVTAGERVALLGRNGSGKSTLLGLASGIRAPQSGEILLDGERLDRVPARDRARRIAVVAQALAAPLSFTVRELVSLGRTPYLGALQPESRADREAVDRALERARVDALADRLLGEVSGGERQRASLALALAQEPALLLLDEPTSHLDLHYQVELMELVRELNEQGMTVVAAIHDLNLAALFFPRLLLLHDGRLAADGSPEAVLRQEVLRPAFGEGFRVIPHPDRPVPLVIPSPTTPG